MFTIVDEPQRHPNSFEFTTARNHTISIKDITTSVDDFIFEHGDPNDVYDQLKHIKARNVKAVINDNDIEDKIIAIMKAQLTRSQGNGMTVDGTIDNMDGEITWLIIQELIKKEVNN